MTDPEKLMLPLAIRSILMHSDHSTALDKASLPKDTILREMGFNVNGTTLRGYLIQHVDHYALQCVEKIDLYALHAGFLIINPDKSANIRAMCIQFHHMLPVIPNSSPLAVLGVFPKRTGFLQFIHQYTEYPEEWYKIHRLLRENACFHDFDSIRCLEDDHPIPKQDGFHIKGIDISGRFLNDSNPRSPDNALRVLCNKGQLGADSSAQAMITLATALYNAENIEQYHPCFMTEKRFKEPARAK